MKVTVLMSVHNGDLYLKEAIESILKQTLKDFEFLIIDDKSTDKSLEIINSFKDERIVLIKNRKQLGLTRSLNKGLKKAKGEYIVRMDADDISLPQRLKTQADFMDSNPKIGIAGSWIRIIGDKDKFRNFPVKPEKIKAKLLFETVITHPSVIMRRAMLEKFNLQYDPFFLCSQDYDLWNRAAHFFSIGNIGKPLILYRNHPNQIGQKFPRKQYLYVRLVHLRLLKELGINPTPEELDFHHSISRDVPRFGNQFAQKAEEWFAKLKLANEKKKIYKEPYFSEVLAEYQNKIKKTSSKFLPWAEKRGRLFFTNLGVELKKIFIKKSK